LLVFDYFLCSIVLLLLKMGIKAIKSLETNVTPNPMFDISNMIKIKVEPVTRHYKFIKKIGEGTYGEVFEALH
jgi:serine/threonine protein kinase